MPEDQKVADEEDQEGTLVLAIAAHTHSTVHTAPLRYIPARRELGLTPWNTLCGRTWAPHRTTGTGPGCRLCEALMARRELSLGDRVVMTEGRGWRKISGEG